MLLSLNLFSSVDDADSQIVIRACAATTAATTTNVTAPPARRKRAIDSGATAMCLEPVSTPTTVDVSSWGLATPDGKNNTTDDVLEAANQVQAFLANASAPRCSQSQDPMIMFGYSNQSIVGVYSGSSVSDGRNAKAIIDQLKQRVQTEGVQHDLVAYQVCGGRRGSDSIFGLVVATNGSLGAVQGALRDLSLAQCLSGADSVQAGPININLWSTSPLTLNQNETSHQHNNNNNATLRVRAQNCNSITVQPNNGCADLAGRCGLSPSQFMAYNPSLDCSQLQPGQPVCCSSGTIANYPPVNSPDGACYPYWIQDGDYCGKIGAQYNLSQAQIESYNKQTWGWMGCKNLMSGYSICLSNGSPPMPAPVAGAVCGPQVPGSAPPAANQKLADLNPCPLNACCDVWGQCGITSDFCTPWPADTGAPGTAQPGHNGCISWCSNDASLFTPPPHLNPSERYGPPPISPGFKRVGYFEGWSADRLCYQMNANHIDTTRYHTVHFAFAGIDPTSYAITIDQDSQSKLEIQFGQFKELGGVHRVISIGGWDFSTSGSTSAIFGRAMNDQNRDTLVREVVSFINAHNLDGVDFDWEYPGAQDIYGSQPGTPADGPNYLATLQALRAALPSSKTISVAAPASYWYLRNFPIAQMAQVVDYIVFMTYDLHGQWNVGNKYSDDGCPTGNCLRSHVNFTETINALAMVTKAGVDKKKIMVGTASYGRSFHMAQAGCYGPDCYYTGTSSKSDATPGLCTNTAGILADTEILDILTTPKNPGKLAVLYDASPMSDASSMSDILVYDNQTQWVAYTSDSTKYIRDQYYGGWGFGGTAEWAIDLKLGGTYANRQMPAQGIPWKDAPWCGHMPPFSSLDDLAGATGISDVCRPAYAMTIMSQTLQNALLDYQLTLSGYDDLYRTWSDYVRSDAASKIYNYAVSHTDSFDCQRLDRSNCDENSCDYNLRDWGCTMDQDRWDRDQNCDSLYWTAKPEYFEEQQKDINIPPAWVAFGDQWPSRCYCHNYMSKLEHPECIGDGKSGVNHGFPQSANFPLPQPKDAIDGSYMTLQALADMLQSAGARATYFLYDDMPADNLVQGSALAVASAALAVEQMKAIKEAGQDIEDEEAKQRTALIISIVTLVASLLTPLAEVTGLETAAIWAGFINGATEVGVGLYQTITDPSHWANGINSIIGGILDLGDANVGRLKAAATIWRESSYDQISELGDSFGHYQKELGEWKERIESILEIDEALHGGEEDDEDIMKPATGGS
ncbi:glycosylhydrolase family 18-6 [Apiospora sp. TS-2023a]